MQGSCVPANGRRFTPRMRGEEYAVYIRPRPIWESPPRARGPGPFEGRTSAQNHPRVRGEERLRIREVRLETGITPACAGKRVMKMRPSRVWTYPLSANFSFFFGTSFECRAIPERGARRLFGCQASGLATCYASRTQEQTIGCFTGVHCLYPTSRSLRNGTEYNRAES